MPAGAPRSFRFTMPRVPMIRRLRIAVLVSSLIASLAPAGSAVAQQPNQVTGLSVAQRDGFATVRWTAVPDATDYQIERTPVDAANAPTGTAVIVGVWRPNRTVTPSSPSFADAGFNPGDRFRWRVRARFAGTPQPFSDPVFGTTMAPWGDPSTPGESLRTEWETTQAAMYTSDTNEYAYTAALDQASDRVRVVEIGRTVMNRPINMFIIGHPAPPPTEQAISDSPTALVNCNVHGNEPSSREACLILARELAFADDARTIDVLSNVTVLIVPSINGDGRATNTRGNITGQDLNRDYSLIRQPETFGFVEMLRDYTPEAGFDGHEFGNSSAGDLPVLPPRHLNVAQSIFDESMNMIEGWMYSHGSEDGWWYCPYGCQSGGSVGLSEETILRNYSGLRNSVASLLEARSSGGSTRPDETNTPNNRRRKTYSALYTYQQFLEYYRASQPAVEAAIDEAIDFQVSNTGRIVFRGSRKIPAHPAPHPGEAPPQDQNPSASQILDPAPCGYRLTELQYSGPQASGRPVADRLAAHGIRVVPQAGMTYYVPMTQPLRGLIPLLLDGAAAEPMVAGERVGCRPRAVLFSSVMKAILAEGASETQSFRIGNAQEEESHNLQWSVTEATSDCDDPTDLPWIDAEPTQGTTAPNSFSQVQVVFDAAGTTAPASRSGLLCFQSNDPTDPDQEILVDLDVTYPFTGFFSPVANPPAVNTVSAGSNAPMKFNLGGNRGLRILASSSPASEPVDCPSLVQAGLPEPTASASKKGLQFDRTSGDYQYLWKTSASWIGSCRAFILSLNDGTEHRAYFSFR